MTLKTLGAALLSGAFLLSSALAQPAPAPTPAPVPGPATPGTPPATPAPTPPAPAADSTDGKLDKQFGEHESFKTFLADLQKATTAEDQKAVAAMVNYPFKTKVNGQEMTFENAKDVTRAYDDLFRPSILAAIKAQTYETLTVNAAGVAVGSGQVWFNKVGTGPDAKVLIIALNPNAGM